jgi:hypothetical protein
MQVVRHSASRNEYARIVSYDAADVLKEPRLEIFVDLWFPIFRAEDDMAMKR